MSLNIVLAFRFVVVTMRRGQTFQSCCTRDTSTPRSSFDRLSSGGSSFGAINPQLLASQASRLYPEHKFGRVLSAAVSLLV